VEQLSIYRCDQCGAEINTPIAGIGILFMDKHFITDITHCEFTVIYSQEVLIGDTT